MRLYILFFCEVVWIPFKYFICRREQGQGTTDELRSRDFRKELDEREKEIKAPGARRPAEPTVKRLKIDQVPAASLDADDPLEGDSSASEDSDDDTAALLAELNKIKKERAIEQAKKVTLKYYLCMGVKSIKTLFRWSNCGVKLSFTGKWLGFISSHW